jgi:hypothetical protein
MDAGAVYTPPGETAPICGFNDQVTAALPATLSVEVSSSCADARSTGVTDTVGEAADNGLHVIIVFAASRIAINMNRRFNFTLFDPLLQRHAL